ncbi:hypothetical protein [Alkaliphilus sp. B6464]|uniref:hypothetical protein n=1 Tax=Alkaliphilus sp. B6464 TaxID=2731219 RepID=UPI001BAE0297|nr:hypothetical protein [Alkaliphilus sp. B6464]QUH20605.1 hypothetical protein HYG84_12450 [Alkaliphilus sp. B6464]
MQLTADQQYLVRTNKNLTYHFFLSNDKSLHYSIYANNNTLLENNLLVSSIVDFSVTIDRREKIHLICVTKEGDLLYYINQNDKWNYKTISKFDIKSNIYRYLMLYVNGNYTHIIYTKTNLLTPMLSYVEHIYWNETGIDRLVVGNYIHGKYPSPLQVSIDSLKNLHLVYKVYYKNNHQLYYNRFNLSTKKWSISELITNSQEDHSHPYIFIDKNDNLHLVWCTIQQNNFILKYKKKTNVIDSRSKWSNTQILSNKNSNNHSPILIQESDILKIYCKQNNQIIEIISKDFGHSWGSVGNNLYKVEDSRIIRYSNSPEIDENFFIKHLYGNITDTIEIVGIDLFNSTENETYIEPEVLKPQDPIISTIKETEEYEPKNPVLNSSPTNDFYTIKNENDQSTEIIKELLSNYKTLEKQLSEIEGKKQEFVKNIADCEIDLNLLEEKIVDYKKHMLILQDKLNNLPTNNSMFQRFVNFFK